jgi:excisionase family DNA binding protein
MAEPLLSVFDIATQLNLHVKTVRNYVREGKLTATRIGKQYRISRRELEAFLGHPFPATASEIARRERHVEVSSIVQIDAISPEASQRLEKALSGLAHGDGSQRQLRIDCLYDQQIGRMKIIVLGSNHHVSAALGTIDTLLEKNEP